VSTPSVNTANNHSTNTTPRRKNALLQDRSDSPYQQRTTQRDNPTHPTTQRADIYFSRCTTLTIARVQITGQAMVGKLLGHRSVTTMQRYLHPQMQDIAELVNERNKLRAGEAQRDELRHSREAMVS